jgi:hypothetical protein
MQALIHIIKVNEARSGLSRVSGKPYTMQDAECILLNEDGSPSQVGVLMLPKDLTGKVNVGTYMGTFALQASLKDRRIEAVLSGLQPYDIKRPAAKA